MAGETMQGRGRESRGTATAMRNYYILFPGETHADWFGDYRVGQRHSPSELNLLVRAMMSKDAYDWLLRIIRIAIRGALAAS